MIVFSCFCSGLRACVLTWPACRFFGIIIWTKGFARLTIFGGLCAHDIFVISRQRWPFVVGIFNAFDFSYFALHCMQLFCYVCLQYLFISLSVGTIARQYVETCRGCGIVFREGGTKVVVTASDPRRELSHRELGVPPIWYWQRQSSVEDSPSG